MTSGLTAFAALLLLVGGASARAQGVDQAISPNGTTTAPADPATATPPPPKQRDLLIDVIKTLTQSRDPVIAPAPLPVEPLEPTVISTPAPTAVTSALPRPVAATPLPRPRAIPPVKVDPAPPPVKVTPPPLIVTAPPPRPIDPPTPVIVPQPAPPLPVVAEQIEPVVTTPPPSSAAWPWLLAGVIVTLAAFFTTHRLRQHRRLARTRAALALTPRIDVSAGHGAPLRVHFARPPLAIRATLQMPAHG